MKLEGGCALLDLTVSDEGSGDFLVAIEAQSEGFSGHADGHVVGAAWHVFVEQLAVLEAERKGSARLISAMPGEFELEVRAIDGKGHMGVSGLLSYRRVGVEEWPVQQLRFAFEFDPSKLSAFVRAVATAQQRAAGDARNARA